MSEDTVKEKILQATIDLINDDTENITVRKIAARAGVTQGLINYHFQTKENLIELCVEQIIGNVVKNFNPQFSETDQTPNARLKCSAKLAIDFLIYNPAVSKISILSDYKNPKTNDNTIKSTMHICKTLGNLGISEKEQFILAFTFTSIMQALFLRKDHSSELFGYDINTKEQRDTFIDFLIEKLLGGFGHEE